MFELVIDFSSNLRSASIDEQELAASFIASITPNNYLAAIDFLRDNDILVLDDFVNETDYPVVEY